MTAGVKYSHYEVRLMIRWEMLKSRNGSSLTITQVNKLVEALNDEVISMLEKSGIIDQAQLQTHVDNYYEQ